MAGRRTWLAVGVLVGLLAWFLLSSPKERTTEDVAPPVTVEVPEEPIRTRTAPPQAALEEEPSEDETGEDKPEWTVRCPLTMDAPYEGEVDFAEHLPMENGIMMMPVKAEISGGVLHVVANDPANPGSLEIPGYPDVKWKPTADGGCPEMELKVASAIMGQITPIGGHLSVLACGTRRVADSDGSFYLPVEPSTCIVRAFRTDAGGITVEGSQATVEVVEGKDTIVELTVPEEEWGSLGLMLEDIGDKARVRRLVEGSVADLAGIKVDDVLVAINGEPPVGCDRGWLFNCFHGPLGTAMTLEFEGEEPLELVRARLPRK